VVCAECDNIVSGSHSLVEKREEIAQVLVEAAPDVLNLSAAGPKVWPT